MNLFPSSGEGRKTPTLLGPLERANLNHWTIGSLFLRDPTECAYSSLHLRTETDPVSKMLSFLVFTILNNGQSPESQ
jgi:hypothetical protein